jgi:hypothetical protein
MENNGSIHQAVCQAGGTVWLVEASKRLDEKIRRGKEIRSACPYRRMCRNHHTFCADNSPECHDEWQHFVNNDD